MNQTTNLTRIDILGSLETLVADVVKLGLQLIGFLAFVAAAPILYFFFGLFCARSGDSDFPMIYILTLLLPVAIWTFVICRIHSVRQWRRQGGRGSWREDNGGWAKTIATGLLTMVAGGFFSFVAEMSAVALNWYITGHGIFFSPTYPSVPTPTDLTIFWSLMPVAAFSPVIVVLMSFWVRRDKYVSL